MPHTMHSFETNPSNVPAFLVKLWKLVEDPACNDLIAWSDSGTSFIIKDQTRFSKDLLPLYFKHNNMASFIRQLNMYGFRKVMNYEKSGLRNENDEMEFQHSFFVKDQLGHLALIKRKIPNTKVSEPVIKSNARDILTDLSSIREKQEHMDSMLLKMKRENELLWRELTNMRNKHKTQERVIQKVIEFLLSIVQRGNQNRGVQRKMPRMLHDSSENQGNSQVSRTIDVLRNKNPNFITVPTDKLVSPVGPVIHEVTDLDHENYENSESPSVKSPEDKTENSEKSPLPENQENDCPLISSLNSPINTSETMEPLSILEPLQQNTPVLNADDSSVEESVLGIPLEYITDSPSNVISIPDDVSCDNVISLPDNSADGGISYSFGSTPNMLMYTDASKSDFDDVLMSESLQTPKVFSTNSDEVQSPNGKSDKKKGDSPCKNTNKIDTNIEKDQQLQLKQPQSEHNYQLIVPDSSDALKFPALTNEEKRCTDLISNSEMRFHASVPTLERRLTQNMTSVNIFCKEAQLIERISTNTLSNHVINVEEELNWLQDQITSGSLNFDANKLLGLFSTDDVANNETLAGEIAAQTNIKTEPVDIIGNELVQFTPSMLEGDLDLGNNQFLQCLNSEDPFENTNKDAIDQKNFLADVLIGSDQAAATEAAEYFLNGTTAKQKSPRRPKIQKMQKAKRRKVK